LLHEAGETCHRVFRIVDGADDDWASWYAQWLIDLSELPDLLGARPVRSELTCLLVSLDKQYTADASGEPGRPATHARLRAISSRQAADTVSCTQPRLRAGELPVMPRVGRAACSPGRRQGLWRDSGTAGRGTCRSRRLEQPGRG
jgi:hypothetical protein